MFGMISERDLIDEYGSIDKIPDEYTNLPKIKSHQIAWWDEVHFDQKGGEKMYSISEE